MLVYMFAFSLLAAVGWHLGVDRFYLALAGSVITSVLINSLLMFVFIGWHGFVPFAKEALIFAVFSLLVSLVAGKLIARIKQQKPHHVRE